MTKSPPEISHAGTEHESIGLPSADIDCDRPRGASTKERLLAAAGPIFAQRGFDDVTVRELSSQAKVNVAAVGYHFGDKLGLYRAVIDHIRSRKDQRFPTPDNTEPDPRKRLTQNVSHLLCRMASSGEIGWETQLLLREIQRPTPVFEHIVGVVFRPQFDHLIETLRELSQSELQAHQLEQIALSIVGQCTYYATGTSMISMLIAPKHLETKFSKNSIVVHIVATTLASIQSGTIQDYEQLITDFLVPVSESCQSAPLQYNC